MLAKILIVRIIEFYSYHSHPKIFRLLSKQWYTFFKDYAIWEKLCVMRWNSLSCYFRNNTDQTFWETQFNRRFIQCNKFKINMDSIIEMEKGGYQMKRRYAYDKSPLVDNRNEDPPVKIMSVIAQYLYDLICLDKILPSAARIPDEHGFYKVPFLEQVIDEILCDKAEEFKRLNINSHENEYLVQDYHKGLSFKVLSNVENKLSFVNLFSQQRILDSWKLDELMQTFKSNYKSHLIPYDSFPNYFNSFKNDSYYLPTSKWFPLNFPHNYHRVRVFEYYYSPHHLEQEFIVLPETIFTLESINYSKIFLEYSYRYEESSQKIDYFIAVRGSIMSQDDKKVNFEMLCDVEQLFPSIKFGENLQFGNIYEYEFEETIATFCKSVFNLLGFSQSTLEQYTLQKQIRESNRPSIKIQHPSNFHREHYNEIDGTKLELIHFILDIITITMFPKYLAWRIIEYFYSRTLDFFQYPLPSGVKYIR